MMPKSAVLLLLVGLIGMTSATPKAQAAQQILDIVNNPKRYNKDIIPFPEKSGPLEVQSTMYLRSLYIDDVNMRINVDLTFRLYWQDSRLSYSAPGVPHVRLADVSKFWIPDAFFKDSLKTEQMKTVHPEVFMQITNKGDVLYSTRLFLSLKCAMDLTRFPHDVQKCSIKFASYGFSTKDIVFSFQKGDFLDVGKNVILSGRFTMGNVEPGICDSKTATGAYSCLEVNISLEREFNTYLLEWYVPCMYFVVIAFFSEFLEASALLPRLLLTVGTLLTLTATSLDYYQSLAAVPYTTALDLFTGTSSLTIFATVVHVIISYYYHSKPAEEEKPDVEASTRWKKICRKLRERANYLTRVLIIGFYCAFIFLYFLAYSL